MNPRSLRALLPVIKEAREAGVLEIDAGEGKNRVRLRLAPPEPMAGVGIEAGADPAAPADDAEEDPRFFLERFYKDALARARNGA